jgi:outer membrane protein
MAVLFAFTPATTPRLASKPATAFVRERRSSVRRILFAVALVSLSWPSLAAAQGAVQPDALMARLAYFSPQRAFALSPDGKAADARLSALEAERSKELAARNAKLQDLQNSLQQSAAVLAESARRQRELEVERFQIDMTRFLEDAQAEFLGVQRNLENSFFARLRPALDAVAREKNLLFVINEDAGVLAWANPALDITADVVKKLGQP